jgi:hypothetical protein
VAQLTALSVLMGAYAAQFAGALVPNVPTIIAAGAVGLAADLFLHQYRPGIIAVLGKVRLDVTVRQVLRDLLLVAGLLRMHDSPLDAHFGVVALLLGLYLTHFLCQGVATVVRKTRTLPVVTRNIDVSALRPSAAPPRVLARQAGHRLLRFSVPGTAGLLVAAGTHRAVWAVAGLGIGVAALLAGTVYLGTWLLPKRRPVSEERALEWLDAWLADYRPTVGMYFSGGTTSAYQANMWLSTLAQLDGRPIIVLRERFMVQRIEATDIPIVCLPKVAHLMRLEHSTLKVLLHPANSGKTSQVLRIPSIKHAFTNHGESDKLSSCNPYSKAYDELWVAGPAARERYQLADIGVDDRDVVEVGRPQLAPIQPASGTAGGAFTTVLYAPTWEGWDGQPGNTSVILAGENIVRALLADPAVRLLYKPHPMTGSVDPRAGAANERIKAMILEAVRSGGDRFGPRPGPQAAAELAARTAELDRLTSADFRVAADELERMGVQGRPAAGRAAAVEAATAAWEDAYWASLPAGEHQIITDARPALFSCFNRADLLISDVSSVVSDWLTSEKPYAVANTTGLPEADFRAGFPTVRAATVLSPAATEVPALLEAVRDPAKDRFIKDRAELKEHLLGPSDPPSIVRFNAAALALAAEAEARRARVAAQETDLPGQREAADAAEETAQLAGGEDPEGEV